MGSFSAWASDLPKQWEIYRSLEKELIVYLRFSSSLCYKHIELNYVMLKYYKRSQ
jgi:hypothetical protein